MGIQLNVYKAIFPRVGADLPALSCHFPPQADPPVADERSREIPIILSPVGAQNPKPPQKYLPVVPAKAAAPPESKPQNSIQQNEKILGWNNSALICIFTYIIHIKTLYYVYKKEGVIRLC